MGETPTPIVIMTAGGVSEYRSHPDLDQKETPTPRTDELDVRPAHDWIGNTLLVKYSDLQHLARVAGEALDLHDTDTDLQPGEELTITVTYEDQKALRSALLEIVKYRNPL